VTGAGGWAAAAADFWPLSVGRCLASALLTCRRGAGSGDGGGDGGDVSREAGFPAVPEGLLLEEKVRMTVDRTRPLRVGQVLVGLLEDVSESAATEAPAQPEPAVPTPRSVETDLHLSLLERMLAAAELSFDADDQLIDPHPSQKGGRRRGSAG
jgi:hypothetical protein